MSLQVGGAVLGVAVLTVIDNSVESMKGGPSSASARLKGYQAAYYGAMAFSGLGALLSLFTPIKVAPSKIVSDPEVSTEESVKKTEKPGNNEEWFGG